MDQLRPSIAPQPLASSAVPTAARELSLEEAARELSLEEAARLVQECASTAAAFGATYLEARRNWTDAREALDSSFSGYVAARERASA